MRPGGEVLGPSSEAASILSLYVPTTPNPTGGLLPDGASAADVVIELTMSVDEALKYIISMGVVAPPHAAIPVPPAVRRPVI